MNALVANLVTCAHKRCAQPGTTLVPVAVDVEGEVLELEFCDDHAETRRRARHP